MKKYTIKLHEDDVERLSMLKMEMQQEDGNDDWDMICDIFQQIENQRFEELGYKKLIEDCKEKYGNAPWSAEQIQKINLKKRQNQ